MAITLIVLVVVLAAAVFLLVSQGRGSTRRLKSRFGPEYERAIEESGSRKAAEERLRRREARVHAYAIHPLSPDQRARYVSSWRRVQAEFVDDPAGAISAADQLLGEVMAARGYPVIAFEQQAADLSVEYPDVVQNYRTAHEIALRHAQGEANTEDLRRAMVHYRSLFDELASEPHMRAAS
jgi:predicted nucleic acid-binding protein